MTVTKLAADGCPVCHHKLDAASNAGPDDDTPPGPGDFTVCINCASVLVFSDDMTLRRPEAEDMIGLPMEVTLQLWRTKAAIEHMHQSEKNEIRNTG